MAEDQAPQLIALQPNNDLRYLTQQAVDNASAARNQAAGLPVERMEERRKLDKLVLKKEGNIKQLDFCKQMIKKVDDAFDNVDKDVNKAKEILTDGKQIILRRIKLIRLADRESWEAVKEYESDELASDKEDGKHLNRAIRGANLKTEKRKKLRRFNSSRREEFGSAKTIATGNARPIPNTKYHRYNPTSSFSNLSAARACLTVPVLICAFFEGSF